MSAMAARSGLFSQLGLGSLRLIGAPPAPATKKAMALVGSPPTARRWASGAISKPIFYDMVHSNNAARIRIWIRLKGLQDKIESKMLTYPDLKSEEFKKVSPLQKVPALVNEYGNAMFESTIILDYLDAKYSSVEPNFTLPTPEDQALVQLFVRMHDLYIASPNCSQPGFSHTQGSMYLAPYPTQWCLPERTMDRPTRAAKLAEIWKMLTWMEENVVGPYCAGPSLTKADMTWYPTLIFMEYMLPRVFGWPAVFHEEENFPRLTKWFDTLSSNTVFADVREDIWQYWVSKDQEGQFDSIRGELSDTSFKWVYP